MIPEMLVMDAMKTTSGCTPAREERSLRNRNAAAVTASSVAGAKVRKKTTAGWPRVMTEETRPVEGLADREDLSEPDGVRDGVSVCDGVDVCEAVTAAETLVSAVPVDVRDSVCVSVDVGVASNVCVDMRLVSALKDRAALAVDEGDVFVLKLGADEALADELEVPEGVTVVTAVGAELRAAEAESTALGEAVPVAVLRVLLEGVAVDETLLAPEGVAVDERDVTDVRVQLSMDVVVPEALGDRVALELPDAEDVMVALLVEEAADVALAALLVDLRGERVGRDEAEVDGDPVLVALLEGDRLGAREPLDVGDALALRVGDGAGLGQD